jgi:hypothetical protein
MDKKITPIKYSSRDFNTIKQNLVQHAIRYYPDTFKDFSEASFGSLMLDATSYIGDVLSFYIDYNANESHLKTAIEYNNILKHGYKLGYKYNPYASSSGLVAIYCLVPALSAIAPNKNYAPVIKRGSVFSANGNLFTLSEDVNMRESQLIKVATQNGLTGAPETYAFKTYGRVISGIYKSVNISVGEFIKFRKINLDESNITEIISITDSEGNEYKEVDYLSQNIVYKVTTTFSPDTNVRSNVLVPIAAPRRYVVERYNNSTSIVFGASSNISIQNDKMVEEPTKFVTQMYGRAYIGDDSFDPQKLLNSDKYGIAPSDTTLTITYRVNNTENVNAGVGAVNAISSLITEFEKESSLDRALMNQVNASFVVENEELITGDVSTPTIDELKTKILDNFASQNRAVTEKDYEASAYSMPASLGSVKRCRAIKDVNSFKRNLNLYILSEDVTGNFIYSNSSLKNNLKTWIEKNKMVSDTIDILDAKIINLGIEFEALGNSSKSKFEILSDCRIALRDAFSRKPEIGEPFYITDVLSVLKNISGVLDVKDVKIKTLIGKNYAATSYIIDASFGACRTPDETVIYMPDNVAWEIKFPDSDIHGTIV